MCVYTRVFNVLSRGHACTQTDNISNNVLSLKLI